MDLWGLYNAVLNTLNTVGVFKSIITRVAYMLLMSLWPLDWAARDWIRRSETNW